MANRRNVQARRLHKRLKKRLQSDFGFYDTSVTISDPRSPGKYRAIGKVNPRQFIGDTTYGAKMARVEVGFDLNTSSTHEHYWLNWIELNRKMLVGWHQDSMHPSIGKVHLQVNDTSTPVTHKPAKFIDSHPIDVFLKRMNVLPKVVQSVTWNNGRPTGSTW